jgi:hypothetical protein
MNDIRDEKLAHQTPRQTQVLLAVGSTILGLGALWYAWMRYNLLAEPDSHWYGWIQVAAIRFVGLLCIWAAVLFILGKPSALPLLKVGISIVPLILFFNLIVLIFRVIHNLTQGNATLFLDSVFAQPQKFIVIPIIVIALLLLESLMKKIKNDN